jgi:16S rRNA U1498 N3-methylase RsmE
MKALDVVRLVLAFTSLGIALYALFIAERMRRRMKADEQRVRKMLEAARERGR